jgi:hypothetical protein
MSSLEAMMMGIHEALQIEQERGIVDLDALWNPAVDESLPFMAPSDAGTDNNDGRTNKKYNDEWVKAAHLILSPFARPCGWHIRFQNRSITHALLTHARATKISCASHPVTVDECGLRNDDTTSGSSDSLKTPHNPRYYDVSEATIRIENCPDLVTPLLLLQLFSRYDLRRSGPPVVEWRPSASEKSSRGRRATARGTNEEAIDVPRTFLVHFDDPSWARAAMREKQGYVLKDITLPNGSGLRLVPYPKQKQSCGG